MKAHIHYEAAFEHYLQTQRIPYVAVDEAKRAAFRDAKLKSFDFIVYAEDRDNWLVDIKGRRWAPRKGANKPSWENWATQADVDGLMQWSEVFGAGFQPLLVFAYLLATPNAPEPAAEITHSFRDARYVFAAIPLETYVLYARVRSPKWGTVNMPVADFARHVRPIADWL